MGHPIEVRRLDDGMAEAAEIAIAEVVAEHDDEVGPRFGGDRRRPRGRAEAHDHGQPKRVGDERVTVRAVPSEACEFAA